MAITGILRVFESELSETQCLHSCILYLEPAVCYVVLSLNEVFLI